MALTKFRVSQVALGRKHTLVLLENGEVLSFGDNKFGQLGLGHLKTPVSTPSAGFSMFMFVFVASWHFEPFSSILVVVSL